MSQRKVGPIKSPTLRITNAKGLKSFQKHNYTVTRNIYISNHEYRPHIDEELLPDILSLIHKNKYSRGLTLNRVVMEDPSQIKPLFEGLRKRANIRKLTLLCSNSGFEDRISDFEDLNGIKCLRRLEHLGLNLYFKPKKALFKKLGYLIYFLQVHSMNIKEPLSTSNELQASHFYKAAKKNQVKLKSLKITSCTPLSGTIESSSHFKYLKSCQNLTHIHAYFPASNLFDISFSKLIRGLKLQENLSSLSIDFSYNSLSDISSLESLQQCLKILYLNFNKCSLKDGALKSLSQVIERQSNLKSLKLMISNVKANENSIMSLTNSISNLTRLSEFCIDLSDTKCLTVKKTWQFFDNIFKSKCLEKAEIILNQALQNPGIRPDSSTMKGSFNKLKDLRLSLGQNQFFDDECQAIFEYFNQAQNLESLFLDLERVRLRNGPSMKLFKWISGLKKLRNLDLWLIGASLGSKGFDEMLNMLANSKLQVLSMELNDVVEVRDQAQEVVDCISKIKTLAEIKVNSPEIAEILQNEDEKCPVGQTYILSWIDSLKTTD